MFQSIRSHLVTLKEDVILSGKGSQLANLLKKANDIHFPGGEFQNYGATAGFSTYIAGFSGFFFFFFLHETNAL